MSYDRKCLYLDIRDGRGSPGEGRPEIQLSGKVLA